MNIMGSVKIEELLAVLPRHEVTRIVNAITMRRKKRQADIKYMRKQGQTMAYQIRR